MKVSLNKTLKPKDLTARKPSIKITPKNTASLKKKGYTLKSSTWTGKQLHKEEKPQSKTSPHFQCDAS